MKPVLAAIAAALIAAPVLAHHAEHHDKKPQAQAGVSAGSPMAEGEVRKVDKEAKKLTIRHGPLANLDMPAMTMVFQVKDPAVLEQVKPGDKIRFVAEKVDGGYVASRIEPAR